MIELHPKIVQEKPERLGIYVKNPNAYYDPDEDHDLKGGADA